MLLYPWHPWGGRLIHVHDLAVRGGSTVLRCSLDGSTGRCLEVPAWMFDQAACVSIGVETGPQIGFE